MDCADLDTTAPSPPRLASLPREPDASPPPLAERVRLGAIYWFPLPVARPHTGVWFEKIRARANVVPWYKTFWIRIPHGDLGTNCLELGLHLAEHALMILVPIYMF